MYSRGHASLWKRGKRSIPDNVGEVIIDEAFKRLTPWGDFTVENCYGPVNWVLNLLRNPDTKQDEPLDMAIRLYNSCNPNHEAENMARLAAIIGILFRLDNDLENSEKWFTIAVNTANKSARNLYFRYKTSLLNIQRNMVDIERRSGCVNLLDYYHKLDIFFSEQEQIFHKSETLSDKVLALKHLLRISSLRDDESSFTKYATEARKPNYFGDTLEQSDKALAELFSKENDEDGDFVNARASFKICIEIMHAARAITVRRK
jgi:hypothetical protein